MAEIEPTTVDLTGQSSSYVLYYNDRNEGRVVFFRDSQSRISKMNIITMAHAMSQKWNFDWLHLSKEEFKIKLNKFCKENIAI